MNLKLILLLLAGVLCIGCRQSVRQSVSTGGFALPHMGADEQQKIQEEHRPKPDSGYSIGMTSGWSVLMDS